MLCVFIAYESAGTWAVYEPGQWAPTLVSMRDVALNVSIYVIFGFIGVLALRDTYARHWFRLAVRVAVIALLFSFAIEMLQLYTVDRVASLTDITSAGIGALTGGMVAAAWPR